MLLPERKITVMEKIISCANISFVHFAKITGNAVLAPGTQRQPSLSQHVSKGKAQRSRKQGKTGLSGGQKLYPELEASWTLTVRQGVQLEAKGRC